MESAEAFRVSTCSDFDLTDLDERLMFYSAGWITYFILSVFSGRMVDIFATYMRSPSSIPVWCQFLHLTDAPFCVSLPSKGVQLFYFVHFNDLVIGTFAAYIASIALLTYFLFPFAVNFSIRKGGVPFCAHYLSLVLLFYQSGTPSPHFFLRPLRTGIPRKSPVITFQINSNTRRFPRNPRPEWSQRTRGAYHAVGGGMFAKLHRSVRLSRFPQTELSTPSPLPQTIHPHYDDTAALLVRLYSLPLEYRPGGELRPRGGSSELELQLDKPAAWTLMQLFDK